MRMQLQHHSVSENQEQFLFIRIYVIRVSLFFFVRKIEIL
jgi:hypothetical protein